MNIVINRSKNYNLY